MADEPGFGGYHRVAPDGRRCDHERPRVNAKRQASIAMSNARKHTARAGTTQGSASSGQVETGFYEPYASFARTLRAWFIGYGIGAPVIFLSNEKLWDKLVSGHEVRPFVYLFAAGVAFQVLATSTYKAAMWYLYMREIGKVPASDWRSRAADKITDWYWLEFVADLGSMVLFGFATWRCVRVLAA